MRSVAAFAAASLLFGFAPLAISAGSEHPHHIAIATGGAQHHGENSVYLGVDYIYRFKNDYAAGVFFENVSGDFDLRAYGLTFGKYFSNGLKLGAGPGVEKKIEKNKTLLLFHVSGGYDWHVDHWSFGPVATIDFIEDNSQTYYLGFAVGYGF
jgi:hypothetical protein